MNAVELLAQQLQQARTFLDGTMADVTDEVAHAAPPGLLNPIGATYAHLVIGEDGFVNGLLRGQAPLFAADWAGKTGLSQPPPDGPGWDQWAREVKADLRQVRDYASAVAGATDVWLRSLAPQDLERKIDLSAFGFGEQTMAWVLSAGVVGHVQSHWGEICALKGLQGGKGFPV